MICSKKSLFVISLILNCISASLWSAEPNEAKIGLTFETDNQRSQLWIRDHRDTPGKGPIKPTHVAVFYLRIPGPLLSNRQEDIQHILNTPSGKLLSEQQRKFLTASDAVIWWRTGDIRDHHRVLLYAVNEEDAKKMAHAFLEFPIERNNAKRQEYERKIDELTTQISKIEEELPEKVKQAEETKLKYTETKNARYFSLEDVEANEMANETLLQMDKMLDVLEIELAGIKEKLEAINEYRKTPQDMQAMMRRKRLPEGMLVKLEQMFVEQTIELKSAEARKQAALKIRGRDKAFLDLFKQWKNLSIEGHKLRELLSNSKSAKKQNEIYLKKSQLITRLPVVYQNKVTIHPVLTK